MQLAAFLAPLVDFGLFRNANLTVRRATVAYGEDGIARSLPDKADFTGTVDPSQSENLNRMLEGESLSGAIMIHTRFALTAGDEHRAADVVSWKGRAYQVRAVADWAEGGAGFVSAACTLMDPNPSSF